MQELVIDNIHHIGHVDKNRFLKIYNFIKDRKTFDENNNDISSFKYFYYDDNFHWGFSINNTHRNNIIYGCNVYNYYYFPSLINHAVIADLNNFSDVNKIKNSEYYNRILNTITEAYLKEHNNDSLTENQIKNYVNIILDKIRPTKDYIEYLKKLDNISKLTYVSKKQMPITKKENNIQYNAYIYGIEIDNKLVYIGKTTRKIKERLLEHMECVFDTKIQNSQQNYLYKAMRECKTGYKFKILYENHSGMKNEELEAIEKTLIENIKPEFNYEGVKVPYRFTKEKK